MAKAVATGESTPVAAAELFASEQYIGGFRRIVILLLTLVIGPTALLLAVGILMLVFYEARLNVVFGILVVTLVLVLAVGSGIAMVFLRREAKISQLQSDFVSKVSHELRTPLTSIRLFVETLQRGDLPGARREACLEALGGETARLSERIERLLDWGRMEAGKRVYQLSADDVPSLLYRAVDAFDSVMLGQGVEVRVDIDDNLPRVRVDREAIVDALVNLLTNAQKYSGDASMIRLGAKAGQKWVRISVSDRGRGIPRSEHRRIFQKFYRVDERLSRAVEGSGLGLAMVQHIAQGHGGRVELESEVNRGSTFTLLLPREEVSPEVTV
jgi:two-component system phosphate regulon sensor histidine kinase PhoR